jgi:hypothetical protein
MSGGLNFHSHSARKERNMAGFIDRSQWATFLDEFSKRNQLRPTRLEVVGGDIGAQEQEAFLPFVGVSVDTKGESGSIEIALGGETAADERQLTHHIRNVERIAPLIGTTGVEDGLGIEDRDGVKTLLSFAALREIEAHAAGQQ